MTQLKVKVNWELNVPAKEFREYLLKQEALRPYELVIGAKHAEYLEFGTGPAQNREGEPVSRYYYDEKGNRKRKTDLQYYKDLYAQSEFYRAMYDWVRRKSYPEESKKEQYRIAYNIYQKICREGLAPRPFWRPAFYYMCEHMQEWFNEGMSTKDIIEMMYKKITDLMDYNMNAPIGSEYMRYNGTMEESMVINPLTWDRVEDALEFKSMPRKTIRGMSDEQWEAKTREQGSTLW